MGFSFKSEICQPPYLGVPRELGAHIAPIASTDEYFESSKYELPGTSVSGPTKNRLLWLKIYNGIYIVFWR